MLKIISDEWVLRPATDPISYLGILEGTKVVEAVRGSGSLDTWLHCLG